ncbi:hypothetical protein J6590_030135 [Homalodisca vitripennis]|nr:hypothetical protein J6590_030135 [Homalodisca vitripennis]
MLVFSTALVSPVTPRYHLRGLRQNDIVHQNSTFPLSGVLFVHCKRPILLRRSTRNINPSNGELLLPTIFPASR